MSKSITVGELKDILAEYSDDVEVRLMSQPSWPFEYTLKHAVVDRMTLEHARAYEDGETDDDSVVPSGDMEFKGSDFDETPHGQVLFLLEGHQACYGDKLAWEVAQ